jgi:hypothetical protein
MWPRQTIHHNLHSLNGRCYNLQLLPQLADLRQHGLRYLGVRLTVCGRGLEDHSEEKHQCVAHSASG